MWAGMAPGQVKNRTLGREQTHIHSWVGSSEPGPCKNADIFQSGVEACNLIGKGSNMGRHSVQLYVWVGAPDAMLPS